MTKVWPHYSGASGSTPLLIQGSSFNLIVQALDSVVVIFCWVLFIGAMFQAILGTNLMRQYNLMINLKSQTLVDCLTIYIQWQLKTHSHADAAVFAFCLWSRVTMRKTTRLQVHTKAWHFIAEHFKKVKDKFKFMRSHGIISPTHPNWSSARLQWLLLHKMLCPTTTSFFP